MVSPKRAEGRTEGWARGGSEVQEMGGGGEGGRGRALCSESRGQLGEATRGSDVGTWGLCCPVARLAKYCMFISKGFLFLIPSSSVF